MRDLFHKLAGRDGDPDIPRMIVDHLIWLLNIRRDRCPHLQGYGMPDFEEYIGEKNMEIMVANEIRRVIERYEPRLSQVRVVPDSGDKGRFEGGLHAMFLIEGHVREGEESLTFHEEAKVGQTGEIEIL